jgi:hypothetical protein
MHLSDPHTPKDKPNENASSSDPQTTDVPSLSSSLSQTPITPMSNHMDDSLFTMNGSNMCQCISTAVSLLEVLALDDCDTGSLSISQLLRSRRRALKTCGDLLNCFSCSQTSRFLMLMIQICEKAVQSYINMANDRGSRGQPMEDLTFNGYDASSEEKTLVFGSLTSYQLEQWKTLLSRLLDQCRLLGLIRHGAMVQDLDRAVRMQIIGLRISN